MVAPLGFMLSDRAYYEDIVTLATYHSIAIEGSTLSHAETYAILWNNNTLKIRASARELYEAVNLKYALNIAMDGREPELREGLIRRIASQINRNINEFDSCASERDRTQIFREAQREREEALSSNASQREPSFARKRRSTSPETGIDRDGCENR